MKIGQLLSLAAVVAGGVVVAAPAEAQHRTVVVTRHTTVVHRRNWRGHRPHCWTEWRHHHRVRICR